MLYSTTQILIFVFLTGSAGLAAGWFLAQLSLRQRKEVIHRPCNEKLQRSEVARQESEDRISVQEVRLHLLETQLKRYERNLDFCRDRLEMQQGTIQHLKAELGEGSSHQGTSESTPGEAERQSNRRGLALCQ